MMMAQVPMKTALVKVFQQGKPVGLDTSLTAGTTHGRDFADGSLEIGSPHPKLAKTGSWISRMLSKMSIKKNRKSSLERVPGAAGEDKEDAEARAARLKKLQDELWKAVADSQKAGWLILNPEAPPGAQARGLDCPTAI
mmetsp:Transcript_36534/g.74956  ORF Transcript_36534/g.74956 Transcript_36534/m.74956 type:complete len:139 (+) Transcript_36534:112-528(+)|eukprot:CAMPEP_0181296348 /NCGR_PEP_ID=MMETSP1101-20121128/4655_1 /TAXON_ID=46948 /ORGANISM="Rhodomonas abbreviata, Strain Caron Lab Isolate" /LENGTH=138 /DNA_ID=CAMNT_0023401205 /DNA_START=109 /DNA_END=525 /DNA_ORIENTATION=+